MAASPPWMRASGLGGVHLRQQCAHLLGVDRMDGEVLLGGEHVHQCARLGALGVLEGNRVLAVGQQRGDEC